MDAAPTLTPDQASEERYIIKTKDGCVDQEYVNKYREAHTEALNAQNGGVPEVQAQVNGISSN